MSFLMEKEITRIVDALTSMQNDRGFRIFFPTHYQVLLSQNGAWMNVINFSCSFQVKLGCLKESRAQGYVGS